MGAACCTRTVTHEFSAELDLRQDLPQDLPLQEVGVLQDLPLLGAAAPKAVKLEVGAADTIDADTEQHLLGLWDTNSGSFRISKNAFGQLCFEEWCPASGLLVATLKREGIWYSGTLTMLESSMILGSLRLWPEAHSIHSMFKYSDDEPSLWGQATRRADKPIERTMSMETATTMAPDELSCDLEDVRL